MAASRWWVLVIIVGGTCAWGCTTHGEEVELSILVEPRQEGLVAGRHFTCQLQDDGEVRCWGRGYAPVGALTVDEVTITNPTRVAIGIPMVDWGEPVCALDRGGKVICSDGVPTIGPAVDVDVGSEFACAVLVDGERVACWALPVLGAVAGEVAHYQVPQAVEVAVSESHACALTRRGAVICWGLEGGCSPRWMVGFGMGMDIAARIDTCVVDVLGVVRCLPPTSCPAADASWLVRVPGIEGAQQVATGYRTNCAVVEGGVGCWHGSHSNEEGAPALGEFVQFSSDTQVRDLAVGEDHACVAMASGEVQCWGSNRHHELDGLQHPFVIDAPRVVAGLEDVSEVVVESGQSCARQRGGAIHCWGNVAKMERPWSGTPSRLPRFEGADLFHDSMRGDIGVITREGSLEYLSDDIRNVLLPEALPDEWDDVERTEFDDGERLFACALAPGQPPACSTFGKDWRTVTAPQVLGGVRDIALCLGRAWVLDPEGSVWLARVRYSELPLEYLRRVVLSAPAVDVECFVSEACARLEDGAVACWSDTNIRGSLYSDPFVVPLSRPSVAMTMGLRTACAWSVDGQVECWGDPEAPALAYASARPTATVPQALANVDDAISVSISHSHGCVAHADGKVSCWGRNDVGQAGFGSGAWRSEPVEVLLP
jgi:hypothetical protein